MIFAPCPFHREAKTESGESESVDGIFFKAVHVFDVAQTDGKELPDVDCPVVDADASALLNSLERVAGKRGIALKFEALEGRGFGYATDKGASIVIDNSPPSGQRAKTLAHELAHCALHFGKTEGATTLTRNNAVTRLSFFVDGRRRCVEFAEYRQNRFLKLGSLPGCRLGASGH